MDTPRNFPFSPYLGWWVLIMTFLVLGCDREPTTPEPVSDLGAVRKFTGTWTATGNRQTMHYGADNEAVIFKLSGSMLLSGEDRPNRGFKAEVIGFFDDRSGMLGRCVWTDERGDKVYSELHADSGRAGQLIEGSFLGGTGRYTGVEGGYTFKWKRLMHNENGETSGRTVDLNGWVRRGAANTSAAETGVQQ